MTLLTVILGMAFLGPPPLGGLLNKKPMPIHSVMGVEKAPGEWEITIATEKLNCKDLVRGLVLLPGGGTAARFMAAERLKPEGGLRWALTSTWFAGRADRKPDGTISVHRPPRLFGGAAATVFVFAQLVGSKGETLILGGIAPLTRCALPPAPKGSVTRPQAANLTVAGRNMTVAAATVRRAGGRTRLVLSTGAMDCDRAARAETSVTLTLRDGSPRVERLYADGTRIPGFLSASSPAGKAPLTARPGPNGVYTLTGRTKINGYPVAIAGTVNPVVCGKPGGAR